MLAALAVAGCGGDDEPTPQAATATPEPAATATAAPPGSAANAFIGSMAVDPADGRLYLGTGLGLYRVNAQGRGQRRIRGSMSTPEGEGNVSANLVVRFRGAGEMLGSGHPEGEGSLPEDLGLMRTADGGRTWEPISELGAADYHILQVGRDRVVGVKVEETDIQVSTDGGRTWEARTAPAMPVDVEFDPADPRRMVVSTAEGTFTSGDGGGSWRKRDPAAGGQLEWAAPDALFTADAGGTIRRSADGGATWEEAGKVDLTVNELVSAPGGALLASIPGGEVHRSTDGGATWEPFVKLE